MSIIERIDDFNKKFPEYLIKRKYELLKTDPFTFFRGTNHIFYQDLNMHQLSPSPNCWLCGDLHLENFGSFKGDNRLVYFDLNDFDESILGNLSWEVARVITSILIGFHSLKITDQEALKSVKTFLKKYSQVLSEGKPKYIEPQIAKGIVRKFLNKVKERSDGDQLLGRTKQKGKRLHLSKYGGRQLQINKILKKQLIEAFTPWMESNNKAPNNYKVLDVRFRSAGTGSVGINRYVFLIQKVTDNKKHMLIDMKEATSSSLVQFIKIEQPKWTSESERMITVQKIMQNTSPAQLSSMNFQGKDYVMQELQPTKDRINFKLIENKFQGVCNVIEDMALLTASAHLRGAGRKGSSLVDDIMDFGMKQNWQDELMQYAINYKNVMIEYYNEFKDGKSSLFK